MPKLRVDDIELHYLDEGEGLPVLLLHGFPLNGRSFEPQLRALRGRYRFLVPDHRGFGQSALGSGPLRMERIARDALALLDHAGVSTAVVGGVSMGGYAAMALLGLEPGRVAGLVLVDTQAVADEAAAAERREALALEVLARGPEALIEGMLPKLLFPGAEPGVRAAVEAMIRAAPPPAAAAALRGMALRPDSRGILARYAGPALVVFGEHDLLTPEERARQMADLLSAGSLVRIPGAGHLSNLESPAAFNEALETFLRALSPPR